MTPELERIRQTNKDIYEAIISELSSFGFDLGQKFNILYNELYDLKDQVTKLEAQVKALRNTPADETSEEDTKPNYINEVC